MNSTQLLILALLVWFAMSNKSKDTRNVVLVVAGILFFCMMNVKEGFSFDSTDAHVELASDGLHTTVTSPGGATFTIVNAEAQTIRAVNDVTASGPIPTTIVSECRIPPTPAGGVGRPGTAHWASETNMRSFFESGVEQKPADDIDKLMTCEEVAVTGALCSTVSDAQCQQWGEEGQSVGGFKNKLLTGTERCEAATCSNADFPTCCTPCTPIENHAIDAGYECTDATNSTFATAADCGAGFDKVSTAGSADTCISSCAGGWSACSEECEKTCPSDPDTEPVRCPIDASTPCKTRKTCDQKDVDKDNSIGGRVSCVNPKLYYISEHQEYVADPAGQTDAKDRAQCCTACDGFWDEKVSVEGDDPATWYCKWNEPLLWLTILCAVVFVVAWISVVKYDANPWWGVAAIAFDCFVTAVALGTRIVEVEQVDELLGVTPPPSATP